jgi:hypothetical protein
MISRPAFGVLARCTVGVTIAIALCRPCHAANSTTTLGAMGLYDATVNAPDNLTTTSPGTILNVTDGSAAPVRPADLGVVRMSAKNGAQATFSGRTTGWGCAYTVNGVYAGSGTTPTTWTSIFNENNNPRVVLRVNDDSVGDDVITQGGFGTLRVWVFGTTGTVTVNLAVAAPNIISGLPPSVDVNATLGTPAVVTIGGQSGGRTAISGSATVNGQNLQAQTPVAVSQFSGTLTPDDNFSGRSYAKVGVGETGRLSVTFGSGATPADIEPLLWRVVRGGDVFTLSNVDTASGTANFTAGNSPGHLLLGLTSVNGRTITYSVEVLAPVGAYQVIGSEGKFEPESCSAFMANYTYLIPKDVSFDKIQVNEGICLGVGTGSKTYLTGRLHPAWSPKPVSQGNIATGCLVEGPNPAGGRGTSHEYDLVAAATALDTAAGTFDWNIPWQYSIGNVSTQTFTYLLMHVAYDGHDSVTISKGGVTATETGP